MTFTYTPGNSDRDLIRLLLPDKDEDNPIYQDEELDVYLALEGNAMLATADALETMASNEAYIQKVIKLGDLQTNGAETAKALMARVKSLRDRALTLSNSDISNLFDWAQWGVDVPTQREIIWKDMVAQEEW